MTKRFMLFAGDDYYPLGGTKDFKGAFDDIKEAIRVYNTTFLDFDDGWANIFDLETETTVKYCNRGEWSDDGEF